MSQLPPNPLTAKDVKLFLNDFPNTNKLLMEEEFTPERIQSAIRFVVNEWNETVPILSSYTPETFPYRNTLLYGVCSWLYAGQAISQERNHLTYSSGGVTIDDDNKSNPYLAFSQFMENKFKQNMKELKQSENLKGAWGTINSSYRYLSNY